MLLNTGLLEVYFNCFEIPKTSQIHGNKKERIGLAKTSLNEKREMKF